jgi:uncharacterized protein involved in outer membrane biogenesis
VDSKQKFRERAAAVARSPRTRKLAIGLVAILVTIGILGALVAPYVLRRVLSDQLTTQLHRPVTIEKISINPYAMTAAVHGFSMKERSGGTTALSFEELYLNVELMSLFRLGLVLKELRLVKPYINLVRGDDFKYNFQDLIDEFTSGPAGPTPRFSLNNIQIMDGNIDFDDRPEQTKHKIERLQLGIPFISSLPSYSDIFVKPVFAAVVNGTPFDIRGETKPFKDTHESVVQVNIDDLQIPKYLRYSPLKLNFTVPSGRIDGKLTASFKTAKGEASMFAIAGDIGLRELVMKETEGTPLLNLPTFDVDIGSLQLFDRKATLKSIRGQGLELYLKRRRDGAINVANLTAPQPNSDEAVTAKPDGKKDAAPFLYQLDELLLEGGTIHYTDESTATSYRNRFDNVRVEVKSLTNHPGDKSTVEASLDSQANERINYSATVQLAPLLAINGKFDIKNFRLGSLFPYYESVLNLEIRQGLLDLAGSHAVEEGEKESKITLSELNAAFRSLQLHLPGKAEPLWRVPSLVIKDVNLDVNKRAITIGGFTSQGAVGAVEREADGTINYARLFKRSAQAAPAKAPETTAPWLVTGRNLALDRFQVVFDDKALPTPAKIVVSDLSWRQDQFSTAKNSRGKLAVQAKINNGQVRLTGTAGADPAMALLQVEAHDVDLVPLQPYLEDQLNCILTGGRLGTKGTFHFDGSAAGPAKITYSGELGIADFSTVEKDASQDLLKWQLLNLGGIQVASNPMQVQIGEIDLAGFYSRLVLGADGKINLQKLVVDKPAKSEGATAAAPIAPKAAPATPAQSPAAPASEERVSIGKISLRDGNINFSDLFVKPNYSANLTAVQGTITELKPEAPGDLALEAKLDGYAPVDIRGKINPMGKELFMDIKAKASEIELSPFSPYSGKYVGYGIEKGQLTFDVAYKLENRKLDAQTQFILNQLTFGEKIESPTATSLPVTLAVALLKDRNGVIDVGLPISGTLDDPQFSVGGIIWRLIVNIITRAVTAPFALLGAAFGGGGGAELSYIEFDYGRTSLSQSAEAKIKTLANAMNNRPGLRLEITGRAEPTSDLEGLRRVSLENKVRAQKMKELARQGTAPKSVAEVQVGKEEYERFLRAAYDAESFPKPRNLIGLARSLPVPEMESLMLKHTTVSDDDVRALANQRAQVVRDRLLTANISADRLFIVTGKAPTKEESVKARPSRVDFFLR